MENTNNKITETKFTQNDVLKGLMAMNEELREFLGNITLEQLDSLANNLEYLEHMYKTFDVYIAGYQKMKEAVKVFVEIINEQKENSCGVVIAELAEQYKNLSVEEKTEFCKQLAG